MGCKLSLLVAFMVTLNSYAGPTQKTQYRGFTVHKMDYKTLLDARENWGANQVRYMIAPAWHQGDYPTKMAFFEARVKELSLMLDNARRLGLSVIVDLHQIPNDDPRRLSPDKKFTSDIEKRNASSALYWEDQNNLRILKECWAKLAKVTAAFPDVDVWLELLNEPLDWNDFPSYPRKWPSWAEQTIQEIRKIDRIHPVVFASGPGALSWGMRDLKPLKDPCDNVIYTIHMWQPHGYTHQGVVHSNIQPWPGVSPGDSNAYWDKNKIIKDIQGVIDFQ
ncbi:MAG: glycoside hydrolase family 5 protein, partial [Phycisphaeraceae bacterium JB051]